LQAIAKLLPTFISIDKILVFASQKFVVHVLAVPFLNLCYWGMHFAKMLWSRGSEIFHRRY